MAACPPKGPMFTVGIQNKHTGVTFYLKLADTATFDDLSMQVSTVISEDPSSFSIGRNGKRMDEGYRRVHDMFSMSNQDGKACIFVLVAPARGGGRGQKRDKCEELEPPRRPDPLDFGEQYDKGLEIAMLEGNLDSSLFSAGSVVDTAALPALPGKVHRLRKLAKAKPSEAFVSAIRELDKETLYEIRKLVGSRQNKTKKLLYISRKTFEGEHRVMRSLQMQWGFMGKVIHELTAIVFVHQYVDRFGYSDWARCSEEFKALETAQ